MNVTEAGRFISGLLHAESHQPQKKDVLFAANEVYGINRRQFLTALGLAGIGIAASACAPGLPTRVVISPTPTRAPLSSKDTGYPLDQRELGQLLKYEEGTSLAGNIEFRNESRLVNLTIAMSRINEQTGIDTGLLQLRAPLLVRFTDQPSVTNTSGGETIFDPRTGYTESEIAMPFFVKQLLKEVALPNTSLTTEARKRGYLSVLLSQVTLVEMSNQAHMQQYIGGQIIPNIDQQIDMASNQLGVRYIQQVIAGQSKPFIIVNSIN